jgi:hopene-associated glycosyltransferase HpnB
MTLLFGLLPLLIWFYLLIGRGGFWRLKERDDRDQPPLPAHWPRVVAVVPARNEADVIGESLSSLLAQDYPGDFHIVLVDDQSEDGTAAVAASLDPAPPPRGAQGEGDVAAGRPLAALPPGESSTGAVAGPSSASEGRGGRIKILAGAQRPSGWTGKLWAMQQGMDDAMQSQPDFLWFTDADIAHAPDSLSRLVARAQDGNKMLVSLMARLSCRTPAEHFLIPAFVFFFAMLYPFRAVNDPKRKPAAAAGGCMLVRAGALAGAGGIAAIRHNIIDDCALGRLMKSRGPIWLGLTSRAVSLRPYRHLSDIRRMVARSAYAQLGYSPLLLAGTLAGLVLLYVAPVLTALLAAGWMQLAGWAAWAIMSLMFMPMLRFYDRSLLWAPLLPLIGLTYAWFTLDSAIQHWSGRGGMWKGRAQAEGCA